MTEIGIFVGTVYGNAMLVAEEAASALKLLGHDAKVFQEGSIEDWQHYQNGTVLIVTATTGQGELPHDIEPLYQDLKNSTDDQSALRYGLIALGDRNYDNFCGGGVLFDALLQDKGATRIGDVLKIDASEYPEPELVSSRWVEHWISLI